MWCAREGHNIEGSMSQSVAQKGMYGAVVPVRDLAGMRSFYRDVVQLGEPIMDSNFWVEFRLPGNGILVLEKRDSAKKPEEGQGLSWLMCVEKMATVVEHLEKHEVKPVRPDQEIPGVSCRSFLDPEGNPFTLYESANGGSETNA